MVEIVVFIISAFSFQWCICLQNQASTSVNVQAGNQTTLKCSITNRIPTWVYPNGGIVNFHDFTVINPSFPYRDRYYISSNGDLIITNTQQYDGGKYICSYPGSGNETIALLIGVHVEVGNQVTLNCSLTTIIPTWIYPNGDIVNFHDFTVLNPSFPHRDRFSVSHNGGLTIIKAQRQDNGTYICSYPGLGNNTINLLIGDIDGGWSLWGGWIGCTHRCEGSRVRIRTCSNPYPYGSGTNCIRPGFQEETCYLNNCQIHIDGGWSDWGAWIGCTHECRRVRIRARICNNPYPTATGMPCSGADHQEEPCRPSNCNTAGIVG